MTKKQNDEFMSENEETTDESNNQNIEYITSDGKRVDDKKDDKSINDDINDYVFLTPRRMKKKVRVQDSSSIQDYEIVASHRDRGDHSSHNKRHKKKRMKTWKKVLISIACVLISIVVIVVSTLAILIYTGSQEMMMNTDYSIAAPEGVEVQNQGQYIIYNGQTYELNESITNILFMGIDKREIEGTAANGTGGQADVIVLMAVDTSTGKISMINISRDTMTDVTQYSAAGTYVGMKTEQICLSYAYGDGKERSCENTVSSVKRLFYNIPIKSYLAIDLNGIAAVNDSIGGVDVTSPETIGEFVEGQSYHLEGDMAESFVRTRSMERVDANNLRMRRQQTYVKSFMDKAIVQTKRDISTPLNLFNASAPYTCTNLNPSKICYLAETAVTSNGMSIDMSSVPGEVKMGETYAEFYVNEKEFYELFLNVFYTPI